MLSKCSLNSAAKSIFFAGKEGGAQNFSLPWAPFHLETPLMKLDYLSNIYFIFTLDLEYSDIPIFRETNKITGNPEKAQNIQKFVHLRYEHKDNEQ